tara:strand:+ start:559 stop:708 length:150 start_codon:yes stop_codon:yes gene_type:complete
MPKTNRKEREDRRCYALKIVLTDMGGEMLLISLKILIKSVEVGKFGTEI